MNTKSVDGKRLKFARTFGATTLDGQRVFPDDKARQKHLRGLGFIDRNGFPILDPPGARNRLPRRCHERLHKFKVTKSTDLNEYDHKTGKSLYKLEKVCVNCQHTDTETRWG